jgi:transposase
VVDTAGLLLVVLVTAASVQVRDGGRPSWPGPGWACPRACRSGPTAATCVKLVDFARQKLQVTLEIVKKPKGQHAFEALLRRWVVERTLSWLVRCRLGHDYERLPAHAEALVKCAMIGLMAGRPAPPPGRRPWQAGRVE